MLVIHDYSAGRRSTNGHSKRDIVFLVWGPHSVRAETMSKYLGACLFFIHTSRIRHLLLLAMTLVILRENKPEVIFCQSGPMTCPLVALIYRYLFARRKRPNIVIDAHNSAFRKPWSKLKFLSRFIMNRAIVTIVTNTELQRTILREYNVKARVLEDPIPKFDESTSQRETDTAKKWQNCHHGPGFKVCVINPFTHDSPLRQILDAAVELDGIAEFYITGDFSKADKILLRKNSNNVILTGFLPISEYVHLLHSVDAIIDLSSDPEVMLAGAYEAVAVGKVLITSDNIPLKRYFNKGTIHVRNSGNEIKKAILRAQEHKQELEQQMHELRYQRQKEWEGKFSSLLTYVLSEGRAA
jgi:hypothetical protein